MLVSFRYGGQSYVNFDTDSDTFRQLDIPQSEKDKIVSDAKWAVIREKRNLLMRDTDWTQMPDVHLAADQKTAFADYRQALRDIPQNYEDPDTVVWPEKPAT